MLAGGLFGAPSQGQGASGSGSPPAPPRSPSDSGSTRAPCPPPPTPQLSPAWPCGTEGTGCQGTGCRGPRRRHRGARGAENQGPKGKAKLNPSRTGSARRPSTCPSGGGDHAETLKVPILHQATPTTAQTWAAPGRLLIGAERGRGRGQSHQYDVRVADAGWWRELRGPRHCARADCALPGAPAWSCVGGRQSARAQTDG